MTFERTYQTDPDDLWDALTDPDRLLRWFGRFVGPVPRKVGDSFHLDLGAGPDDRATGTVIVCQAPEHLAAGWQWQDESPSRVDAWLTPVENGTTLLLTHQLAEATTAVGYGGGWEQMLTSLARQWETEAGQASVHDGLVESEAKKQWADLIERQFAGPGVRISRVVPAPVSEVWTAFTTAAGLGRWWWAHLGARHEVDLRVGGHYRFAAPEAGIAVTGTYLEIEPESCLALSWIWQDADGDGRGDRVEINFSEQSAGTLVQIDHRGPWPDDQQSELYATGWDDVLTSLARTLG